MIHCHSRKFFSSEATAQLRKIIFMQKSSVSLGNIFWQEGKIAPKRWSVLCSGFLLAILEPLSIFSLAPFIAFTFNPESIADNSLYLYLNDLNLTISPREFFHVFGYMTIFILISLNALILFHNWAVARFSYGLGVRFSQLLLEGHLAARRSSNESLQANALVKNVMSESVRAVEWFIHPVILASFKVITLFLMAAALLVYSPLGGVLILGGVFSVYTVIYLSLKGWLTILGKKVSDLVISRQHITHNIAFNRDEMLSLEYCEEILNRYSTLANDEADLKSRATLFAFLPKLAIEGIALAAVCVFILIYIGFSGAGADANMAAFAVFALFIYRAMPAAQNIYYGVSRAKFNLSACQALYDAIVGYQDLSFNIEKLTSNNGGIKCDGNSDLADFKMENLGYKIPGGDESWVLNDICYDGSFTPITAIIGSSGSGKSSLLRILAGVECYDSGSVTVAIKDGALRRNNTRTAIVFQNSTIFEDTLGFNISMKKVEDLSEQDIARIEVLLDITQLTSDWKNDLSIRIGLGGRELSGGEAQRLCVARALYRNPTILLLDEATSALDEKLEYLFLKDLKKHCLEYRIKVYMIAHRAAAINFADDFVRIENGRILDYGLTINA